MKPNRVIMDNYEDMSVTELTALIGRLNNLKNEKLMQRADEHADKLSNLICDIMDDGFVVYCAGAQIEPSDLDVRIE